MFNLSKLVRPNIIALKKYQSARDEFTSKHGIFLDANENPFGTLNRYPDPSQTALKTELSKLKNIPIENIFIGNGSDEVIDLALRIFCSPGHDKIIICPPTYGMYEVSANTNDVEVIKIPLHQNFELDINKIVDYSGINNNAKMIFICSPNNPTGNNLKNIETILKEFKGIVFVDEAYIDFSKQTSFINNIDRYPNLIVSQTFSKAWGLAAARVGICFASKEVIGLYSKIKPPYNVSGLNQQAAINAIKDLDNFNKNIATITNEKELLEKEFLQLPIVKKIYPSDANFLLVEILDADNIYIELVKRKVITRNRTKEVNNCIRITVGTPEENKLLINEIKKLTE